MVAHASIEDTEKRTSNFFLLSCSPSKTTTKWRNLHTHPFCKCSGGLKTTNAWQSTRLSEAHFSPRKQSEKLASKGACKKQGKREFIPYTGGNAQFFRNSQQRIPAVVNENTALKQVSLKLNSTLKFWGWPGRMTNILLVNNSLCCLFKGDKCESNCRM